jgi:hypothetical protein
MTTCAVASTKEGTRRKKVNVNHNAFDQLLLDIII